MRSFANFRKTELQDTIKELCVREGVETQFEILRIELIEAIKLPDTLLNEGIIADVEFNRSRMEDFEENKIFLEEVLRVYKSQFYDELLVEAEAASQLGSSLTQLRLDLKEKIGMLLDELRKQVKSILQRTRSPEDAEDAEDAAQNIGATTGDIAGSPSSPVGGGVAPSPAGGGSTGAAPSSPATAAPSPAGASPTANVGAGTGTTYAGAGFGPSGVASGDPSPSGDRYPRWSDYRGETRPEQGGFTPAAYGSMRPSDSVRGGLSRLWRRATRPVRRIWHGDPNREMSKEHTEFLETLFLENWDQVGQIIDKFQDDVMAFIDQRIDQIAAQAGTAVAPPTPEEDAKAGAHDTAPVTRGGGGPGTEATPDAPDAEAEAGAVERQARAEGDSMKEAREKGQLYVGRKGAEILGLELKDVVPHPETGAEQRFIGRRGGWGSKSKGAFHQGGQALGTGWAGIKNKVLDLVFAHEDFPQELREKAIEIDPATGKRKRGARKEGTTKSRRAVASEWLGDQKPNAKGVLALLGSVYQRFGTDGVEMDLPPEVAAQGTADPTTEPVDAPGDQKTAIEASPQATQIVDDLESEKPEWYQAALAHPKVNSDRNKLVSTIDGLMRRMSPKDAKASLYNGAQSAYEKQGQAAPTAEAPPTEAGIKNPPIGTSTDPTSAPSATAVEEPQGGSETVDEIIADVQAALKDYGGIKDDPADEDYDAALMAAGIKGPISGDTAVDSETAYKAREELFGMFVARNPHIQQALDAEETEEAGGAAADVTGPEAIDTPTTAEPPVESPTTPTPLTRTPLTINKPEEPTVPSSEEEEASNRLAVSKAKLGQQTPPRAELPRGEDDEPASEDELDALSTQSFKQKPLAVNDLPDEILFQAEDGSPLADEILNLSGEEAVDAWENIPAVLNMRTALYHQHRQRFPDGEKGDVGARYKRDEDEKDVAGTLYAGNIKDALVHMREKLAEIIEKNDRQDDEIYLMRPESFAQKLKRYKKMLKENKTEPSKIQQLRKRLA